MTEPDFTNPELTAELAETIKQEPLEVEPDDSEVPSCSNEGIEGQPQQQQETVGHDWPPIHFSEMPKRERNGPIRQLAYTAEELTTRVLDPHCDPDWPLAHLYPIYLSNFRCSELSMCQTAVRQYFAARGLLVRWCFSRADDYFKQFQRKANLYDGLIYFGSEQEATLAVKACNNQRYNNYTMNAFPGREPVYFRADRSILYRNMRFGYVYSEEFLWRHLIRNGHAVKTVVKFDISNGAAEFINVAQMQKAFAEERQFEPSPVAHDQALQKQRYLEGDVKDQILELVSRDPSLVELNPNDPFLVAIQTNQRPKVIQWWGPPEQGTGKGLFGIPPTMKQTQSKVKSMRAYSERALAEGWNPVYRGRTKEDKKMLKRIYNEVRREHKQKGKGANPNVVESDRDSEELEF